MCHDLDHVDVDLKNIEHISNAEWISKYYLATKLAGKWERGGEQTFNTYVRSTFSLDWCQSFWEMYLNWHKICLLLPLSCNQNSKFAAKEG